MSRDRPHRLPGFSYIGFHRYSLTLCVESRRPLFARLAFVEPARSQLLQTARHQRFAVFAYCFMPDHLHALVAGDSDSSDLRRFVHVFKQVSAFARKQATGERLWEGGYYERVLRDEESTVEVAR